MWHCCVQLCFCALLGFVYVRASRLAPAGPHGCVLPALQSILQRLQQCITLTVLEEGMVNQFMQYAVELMSYFYKANQRTLHVPLAAFYNDAGMQADTPI